MNKAEDLALSDNTLPHDAVVLYVRCFRRFMSYQNGDTFVSMPRMAEALRYDPNPRSKDKATQPTKRRLRTLITHLERVGLIKKVQAGNIKVGLSATYKCILATVDNLNKHRHDTDNTERHEDSTSQRHDEAPENKGIEAGQRHEQRPAQRHEHLPAQRHISDTSEQDEEDKGVCTRQDLEWGSIYIEIAQSVGLTISEQVLKAKFDYWKTTQGYIANTTVSVHHTKWRGYCSAIRAKRLELDEQQNQRKANQYAKPTNGTANLLDHAFSYGEGGSNESY